MPTEQDVFFESLYRDNFSKLMIQARTGAKNPSAAEEIVQETFLTALNNYEVFRHHANPAAYLKRVLRFKLLEYNRARNRYLKLFRSLDHDFLSNVAAPSNDSPSSASGILEAVQKALTEEEWYLLRQFTLNGFTHLQIAKELGISVSASQKRLERIRKKLEDLLPEYRK